MTRKALHGREEHYSDIKDLGAADPGRIGPADHRDARRRLVIVRDWLAEI
jgi:hypothetical protein